MGARGLPGRFVPRTRGARDNRGPFPVFSRVIPRLPFYLCCGRGSLRESNKKLGLALLRVGLERAFGFPLLLDLGFQLEEGVSTGVGLRRGRWGGHGYCRLSELVVVAVVRSRSDGVPESVVTQLQRSCTKRFMLERCSYGLICKPSLEPRVAEDAGFRAARNVSRQPQ